MRNAFASLGSPGFREALALSLLAVVSLAWSFAEMNAARGRGVVPYFYQAYYEPAIRVACGQPFEVDRAAKLPKEMKAFLKLERDSLSCDLVPPSVDPNPDTSFRAWYHLFVATAAVWKVTGISWTAIDGMAAVMLTLAAACVYGMFRLWMPLPIAAVLALFSVIPGMKFLLYLRDLNKAPFILASLLVVAVLVTRDLSRRTFLAAMAAIGLLAGIGYGFRPDVLIVLPLLAVAAVFFRPAPVSRIWRSGLVGTAIMFGAFVLAASPVFSVFINNVGTCHWHFSILGLSDAHTSLVGLQPGDISWLSHYDDLVVWRSVESYAERVLSASDVGYCTPMYDQVSKAIYLDVIATFPGDFLTRALAAAWQVIGYGFWGLPAMEPAGFLGGLVIPLRRVIQGAWIVLWAGVILTLFARNVRTGLFACFSLAYLCAYPIVQFDTRHYFHLSFLAWVPVGLTIAALLRHREGLAEALASLDFRAWRAGLDLPPRAAWLRAGAIFVALVALAATVLLGARRYQEGRVADLLDRYRQAPGEASTVVDAEEKDGQSRVTYAGFVPAEGRRVTGRMLRVDFGGVACAKGVHEFTIALAGPDPAYYFKRKYTLDIERVHGPTLVFSPMYFERARLDKVWIEFPAKDKGCLAGVAWLDPRALPPLWVGATVPGRP